MLKKMLIPAMLMLATPTALADAYTVHDLMPNFLAFWNEHGTKPIDERERHFVESVYRPHQDVFDSFTGFSRPEARKAFLEKVGPFVPQMRPASKRIPRQLEDGLRLFTTHLPEFAWRGDIYLLPNGGAFNVGVGTLKGQDIFLFGIDTLAYNGDLERDLTAHVLHEFFHLYHNQFQVKPKQRGKAPLFRFLWTEGLATYATARIKPDLARADILLSGELANTSDDEVAFWAGKLVEHLDATDRQTLRLYLSGSRKRDASAPPPRIGYLVGEKVAAMLARERSLDLKGLARLDEATVRKEMERVLRIISMNSGK